MHRMKYLWAAVLIVLCASLTAGVAFGADGWAVALDEDGERIMDFPGDIAWDASAGVSVEAENTGDASPADDWDDAYDLRSVEGVTPTATVVDRWGLTVVPVNTTDPLVPIEVGETVVVEFDIVGPPFTTMTYNDILPVGLTQPGIVDTLECDWMLANTGALIQTDIAETDIAVSRFTDVGSDQWARYYIEQAAGRVPVIVKGFPEGDYKPGNAVDRAGMAVFITRAMGVAPVAWDDTFPDVGETHWAVEYIESAVANDVVQGYPDDNYWPALSVSRAQMAVFVARAKGWIAIDDVIDTADELFPDVPEGFWAGVAIEACVDNLIVKGYLDGYYRPAWVVSRDQMTVFMWRAFIDETGVGVVLAGPGTAATDPATASYGQSMVDIDPAFAYVAVDAARLDTNLSAGATWDITFTYYGPDAPTDNVVATTPFTMSDGDITAARAAAVASGDPYLMLSAAIPGAVTGTEGTYELEVDFAGVALGRTVTFHTLLPAAAFSGSPLTGAAPLTVDFVDASTNSPTSWDWDFGDDGISDEQSPSYEYEDAGDYTVSLTATNAGGSDTESKEDYITVTE